MSPFWNFLCYQSIVFLHVFNKNKGLLCLKHQTKFCKVCIYLPSVFTQFKIPVDNPDAIRLFDFTNTFLNYTLPVKHTPISVTHVRAEFFWEYPQAKQVCQPASLARRFFLSCVKKCWLGVGADCGPARWWMGGEYCNQPSPSGQLITANEHFDYLEGARRQHNDSRKLAASRDAFISELTIKSLLTRAASVRECFRTRPRPGCLRN